MLLDWTGADEDEGDVNVWEDNWDDDNVEDDFSQQLRSVAALHLMLMFYYNIRIHVERDKIRQDT